MSESPSQLAKRKRVLGLDTSNIIEGSENRRAKRRKDGSPVKVSESASDVDVDGDDGEAYVGTEESRQNATGLGIKLLETLKKATNAGGIPLSTEFIKLPNKRTYPDYYTQIKQPIAFDDIRAKLDEKQYASFEDVKADFDLCFNNAKRYNLKNSDIWTAARDLQKLANSTYNELAPNAPDEQVKSEDEDDETGGDGPSKRKAGRPSGLQAKFLARLNKVIEKTDSEGYAYSGPFMDLVPRKEYPDYYQVIKKPTSFNQIIKRIKDKKYPNPKAFMDDVELVFTNATTYNEDHSQIWEDAKVLQATFHNICSDWRAEYPNSSTSNNTVPKLKLKVPPTKTEPATARLPQAGTGAVSSTPQPQQPQTSATSAVPAASTPSSSVLAQPAPGYARPTPPAIPPHMQTHASRSPSVQVPHPPSINSVELETVPARRKISVHQYGVPGLSSWALRLNEHETGISLGTNLAYENGGAQNGDADPVEVKCNATVLTSKKDVAKGPRWDAPLNIGTNVLEVRVKGTGKPGVVWRITVDRAR
ncbi:bromodomain associated protein [Ceratobasidium sp. AG-Ba]|nr:bromodomain associated protein [Ceratobasidium sp. AG-Ba]